jgi:methylated-DNA-[protein]-cysteine S-methyltransferase
VTTYGEIARALNSRAFRAVGGILNRNPHAPTVPCHRVVMSNGTLGGYAFGIDRKIDLLREEGVEIKDNVVVDFQAHLHRFSRDR